MYLNFYTPLQGSESSRLWRQNIAPTSAGTSPIPVAHSVFVKLANAIRKSRFKPIATIHLAGYRLRIDERLRLHRRHVTVRRQAMERKYTVTNHLRLGVLTDLHLAPAGSPPRRFINDYPFDRSLEMLDSALAWFADQDVDAVAVLGDLVMFEDEESLDAGMRRLASLDKPVLIVPGNHDGLHWPAAIERNLPSQSLPAWPAVTRITDVRVKEAPERWWTGGVRLQDDGPALILSHFPVIDVGTYLTEAGFPYAGDAIWDDSRVGFRDRSHPIVVLSGHVHVRYEVTDGAVLQLGCAALIEPPHCAAILDLREDEAGITVSIEHAEIAPHDVALLPIISPSESTWRYQQGGWHRS